MKPFSLQDALAGKPVVTRDGRKVTELHRFEQALDFPLVGIIGEGIETFTLDGKYIDDAETPYDSDLFMETTEKTVWVNLYEQANLEVGKFTYWYTEKQADDFQNTKGDGSPLRLGGKAHPIVIEE